MNLIRRISPILRTSAFSSLRSWVFKKKLLKFSDRYRWQTQACFYCPEMCRFSCPVADAVKHDGTTPRGKVSLLHLAEMGHAAEQVAGGEEQRQWFLEQCTGCGRCTEFCVYENDVASLLREARAEHFEKTDVAKNIGSSEAMLGALRELEGVVLLCEPGRRDWWQTRGRRWLSEMGVDRVSEVALPHRDWSWGKITRSQLREIGQAASGCSRIWVESPEAAWFLAKGVKEERRALRGDIRLVWQKLFAEFAGREPGADEVFHESYHLGRLFPRLDYSIPMYERGSMPFHHGWNALDCGGEGHYASAHPAYASEMGRRFVRDLGKDGRSIGKIVCQSLSCVAHLKPMAATPVTYWLDELTEEGPVS